MGIVELRLIGVDIMSRCERYYEQSVPALRAAASAYAGDVPSEVLDLLLHAAEVIEFYQDREEAADLGI
jgi:hypothetical protein